MMESVAMSILASIVYDNIKRRSKDSLVSNHVQNAAQKTANEFEGVRAEHLLIVIESVTEELNEFKNTGEPISPSLLTNKLDAIIHPETRAGAEKVIEKFVENLETEISSEPGLGRRIQLGYLQQQSEKLREIQQAIEETEESTSPQETVKQISFESMLDTFISNIDKHILILGSYDEGKKEELKKTRDVIINRGYDASLSEELPEDRTKSLEQNVAQQMQLSSFCIIIDRGPSGHLVEYELAKKLRVISAVLTPENGGSTYMIGEEEMIDINYIRTFEFSESPIEVLDDVTMWAEETLEDRRNAYQNYYPWRE